MLKIRPLVLALLAVGYGDAVAAARGAEETTTVEVYVATEHSPEGLKAGAKVNLLSVNGKTVIPNGKVHYRTSTLAADVEVASVTQVEKPNSPAEAVKVELKVTKDQAAKIEMAKAHRVTVVERSPDGPKTEKRPLTFRLEPTKADK
jgi:hypothetical protein